MTATACGRGRQPHGLGVAHQGSAGLPGAGALPLIQRASGDMVDAYLEEFMPS